LPMEEREIRSCVLTEIARSGSKFVPVGVSVKHVHLSQQDAQALFGAGYQLQPLRPLSQPGQFAAKEQVTVVGPKGEIEKVRILGPVRKSSQVELALSDAVRIGIKAPVKMSGDLKGTPGCTLRGPAGEITLNSGVIVAARHLHMNENQANAYGLKDGDRVAIRVTGARSCILGDIVVRSGEAHELEVHLDTDEANAGAIESGSLAEIVSVSETSCGTDFGSAQCSCGGQCHHSGEQPEQKSPEPPAPEGKKPLKLVTERDINDAVQDHTTEIFCGIKALITPAAADRAAETSIRITRV
jgi:putative phosphotransacetylase